jgi:hypothetical protein
MKAATVLEKHNDQKHEGEKVQIVKELKALLLIFTDEQRNARRYLQKAIDYIEKN